MSQKVLLNSKEVNITLHRLACQLIENHDDFSETVLIGIQPRGKYLADRLAEILSNDYNIKNVQLGHLDITFFRDDFRRGDKPLEANTTEILEHVNSTMRHGTTPQQLGNVLSKDKDILKVSTTKRGGALSGRYEICVWTLRPGVLEGEN